MPHLSIEFFEIHKNDNNAIIGIRDFISWKTKKFQLQNATLVSIEPLNLWFQVQHASLYTNLAFACKIETLSSLYSHALLILTKIIQVQTASGAWTEV